MIKSRFSLKTFAFLVLTLAFASVAHAQATRTWVSGTGDDVNPCSRTAPCKTFAGAISKTADKGEIDCIDPGGFGTITITKNITIDGGGTFSSILNSGTNGVVVNDSATATPNTVVVTLRNLSINGAGTGVNGVRFIAGKELHVEDCIIMGNTGNGIDFVPQARGELFVDGLVIQNLTGATSAAIRLTSTGAGTVAVARINRLSADRMADGVRAESHSRATISDSHFAINPNASINADSTVGDTEVNVKTCSASFSTIGIRSNGNTGTIVRVSDSTITGNGTGLSATNSAQIISYGTNETNGNTAPGGATTTITRN